MIGVARDPGLDRLRRRSDLSPTLSQARPRQPHPAWRAREATFTGWAPGPGAEQRPSRWPPRPPDSRRGPRPPPGRRRGSASAGTASVPASRGRAELLDVERAHRPYSDRAVRRARLLRRWVGGSGAGAESGGTLDGSGCGVRLLRRRAAGRWPAEGRSAPGRVRGGGIGRSGREPPRRAPSPSRAAWRPAGDRSAGGGSLGAGAGSGCGSSVGSGC